MDGPIATSPLKNWNLDEWIEGVKVEFRKCRGILQPCGDGDTSSESESED